MQKNLIENIFIQKGFLIPPLQFLLLASQLIVIKSAIQNIYSRRCKLNVLKYEKSVFHLSQTLPNQLLTPSSFAYFR